MVNTSAYYFSPSAIAITLNVSAGFLASETVQVSVASGAAVKIANQLITQAGKVLDIGYTPALEYRTFRLTGVNTVFGYTPPNTYEFKTSNIFVYLRLDASNNGGTGELIFLPYDVDYDGRILGEGTPPSFPSVAIEKHGEEGGEYYSLVNNNEENNSGLNNYFLHIATIGKPENERRDWETNLQTGQLETAKGNNEKGDSGWEKMFLLVNNLIQPQKAFEKIFFASGIVNNAVSIYIDRIYNTVSDSLDDFSSWAHEHAVATTKSIASYVTAQVNRFKDMFLRKDQDDETEHNLKMKSAEVVEYLNVGKDVVVGGKVKADTITSKSGGNVKVEGVLEVTGDSLLPSINKSEATQESEKWGISEKGVARFQQLIIDYIRSSSGTNLEDLFGQGFLYKLDEYGKAHLFIDYLTVRLKAYFAELEIRRLSYVGGSIVLTPAGSKIAFVKWIDKDGNELERTDVNERNAVAFKCYALADDGTLATQNCWAVGDQARCQTFNLDGAGKYSDVSNKYYWRLVTATGQERVNDAFETIDKGDADYDTASVASYFVMSNRLQEVVNDVVLVGYDPSYAEDSMDVPETNDVLVGMGNQIDTGRGNIIMMRTVAEGTSNAPSFIMYKNVGQITEDNANPYTLSEREMVSLSPDGFIVQTGFFQLRTSPKSDTFPISVYRGDYSSKEKYQRGNTVTYEDVLWECLKDCEGIEPEEGEYWHCMGLGKNTTIYSIECSSYLVSSSSIKNAEPEILGGEMNSAIYPIAFGEYLLKLREESDGKSAVISVRAVIQDRDGKSYMNDGTLRAVNMIGSKEVSLIGTSDDGTLSFFFSDIDADCDRVRISLTKEGVELASTSVTIVRDGVDGSAIRLDLDNENDSMLYDSNGELLSGDVTSTATLYDGTKNISEEAKFSIDSYGGMNASQCSIDASTRVVTVKGLTASSGFVLVKAEYNGESYLSKLTIKKIYSGSDAEFYELRDEGSSARVTFSYTEGENNSVLSTAKLKISVKASIVHIMGDVTEDIADARGYNLVYQYAHSGHTVTGVIGGGVSENGAFIFEKESTAEVGEFINTLSQNLTLILQKGGDIVTKMQIQITVDVYQLFLVTSDLFESFYSNGVSISDFQQTAEGFKMLVAALGATGEDKDGQLVNYSKFDMTSTQVVFDTQKFTFRYTDPKTGAVQEISIFDGNKIKGENIAMEGYVSINQHFRVDEKGDVFLRNATVEGIINRMRTVINTEDAAKQYMTRINQYSEEFEDNVWIKYNYTGTNDFHDILGATAEYIYCPDLFLLEGIVTFGYCGFTGERAMIFPHLIPSQFSNDRTYYDVCRTLTSYNNGEFGDEKHFIKYDELRSISGREVTIHNDGGLLYIVYPRMTKKTESYQDGQGFDVTSEAYLFEGYMSCRISKGMSATIKMMCASVILDAKSNSTGDEGFFPIVTSFNNSSNPLNTEEWGKD